MTVNESFRRAKQLYEAGQLSEAESEYRTILASHPESVEALFHLGLIYAETERLPNAIASWRQARRLSPNTWLIGLNLGIALATSGDFDNAIDAYRGALASAPDPAEILHRIGLAFRASGRLVEARKSWEEALAQQSSSAKLWFHHSLVCAEAGDLNRALESARNVLALEPNHVEGLNLLGAILRDLKRDTEAEGCFQKAIALRPDFAPALNNYGLALTEAGRSEEAIQTLRRAIAGHPRNASDYSNLLLALNYSDKVGLHELFAEHRRWAEQYADSLAPAAPPAFSSRHDDRRLRIGYVSADFRFHPASLFLAAFLPFHNRSDFHIIAYSDVSITDETTSRLRAMVETWRPTCHLSHQAMAELIRNDAIDVLVDLGGHTSGNRLLVFARQPAPIQITFYIYPNTTGLRTMQYRTTDDFLDPPGSDEPVYTEKLVRIPEISWCYSPWDGMPSASLPPMAHAGWVTFGSLNNVAKVTDEALLLWLRLLEEVPKSRLIMVASRTELGRSRLESLIAHARIDPQRVELLGRMSLRDYFKLFERIDIALDPFPYNGVTTTSDTLWMGVPVVTLAGNCFRARQGVCLLQNVGLSRFIASDLEDYLRIAKVWATQVDELSELRATLRDRMLASPIVRGDLFAARLEAVYRQLAVDAGWR
jgi:predicted O-linked N-acetylglucosamine transferase (SPINDLY family)